MSRDVNRATWCVCLWINNDQGSQEYWTEEAQALLDSYPDDRSGALDHLAKSLEESFQNEFNDLGLTGMWADLFDLDGVDWDEVAENMACDLVCAEEDEEDEEGGTEE